MLEGRARLSPTSRTCGHRPLLIPRRRALECPRETLNTSLGDSLVPDIDTTPTRHARLRLVLRASHVTF